MMCFSGAARFWPAHFFRVASMSLVLCATSASAWGQFDLQFTFVDSASTLTPSQVNIFNNVEAVYESLITGFQPRVTGLTGAVVQVDLDSFSDGLGQNVGQGGGFPSGTSNGGFTFFNTNAAGTDFNGILQLDAVDVVSFRSNPQVFTDLVFHEVGHALGFGTLWEVNGLLDSSGQYIGSAGLTAYQEEFSLSTATVPTDGTAVGNARHWSETSVLGNDIQSPELSQTEPNFISKTTIKSFVDLGFTVSLVHPVPEPASAGLLSLGGLLLLNRRRR